MQFKYDNMFFESKKDKERYIALTKKMASIDKQIRAVERSKKYKTSEKEERRLEKHKDKLEDKIDELKEEFYEKYTTNGLAPRFERTADGIETNIESIVFAAMKKLKVAKSNLKSDEIESFVESLCTMEAGAKSGAKISAFEREVRAIEKSIESLENQRDRMTKSLERKRRITRNIRDEITCYYDDPTVREATKGKLARKLEATEKLKDKAFLKEAQKLISEAATIANFAEQTEEIGQKDEVEI